jgi:hypothetical protein
MNASKLFAAVAALAFAGSAAAVEAPVANAVSVVAAAQVSYAARYLNVPTLQGKSTAPQRADVQAEAVEAMQNGRSTFQAQLDFIKG